MNLDELHRREYGRILASLGARHQRGRAAISRATADGGHPPDTVLVHPIVLGRGKPLFEGLHDQLNLKL
jgi:hypothetical protein